MESPLCRTHVWFLGHYNCMGKLIREAVLCFVLLLWLCDSANAILSPKGVNFEGKKEKFFSSCYFPQLCRNWRYLNWVYLSVVQALMGIKASLRDPHGVLDNWDADAVDPCSWTMVTCSSDNLVIGL